jgi:hypothetical protein
VPRGASDTVATAPSGENISSPQAAAIADQREVAASKKMPGRHAGAAATRGTKLGP